MFRKLKELLFGRDTSAQIMEWYQLSYQDGGLTSAIIVEDLDSTITWCKTHLTDKNLIHVYHHTRDGRTKLLLTIKWEV